MLRKRTLKKESEVSQHMTAGSIQEEQEEISLKGLHYEEIPVQRPHCEEVPVQNYHVYHTLEPPAWFKDKLRAMLLFGSESQ